MNSLKKMSGKRMSKLQQIKHSYMKIQLYSRSGFEANRGSLPPSRSFNNAMALLFPLGLPPSATTAMPSYNPIPASLISPAILSPPHCAKFNSADTAFSLVLILDPVEGSSKSTKTPIPETFRNASPPSSHPAICAITAVASSTIPTRPSFTASENSAATAPSPTMEARLSG